MPIFNLLSYSDTEIDVILDAVALHCTQLGSSTNNEARRIVLLRAIEIYSVSPLTSYELAQKLCQLDRRN
ncbi:hypothetical protein DEM27_22125 [Metarhizobium album]|uniref:Uncharacterized protein n=1 Tax=Metarhizobium album TaxID=2182425 RepID=A0A2U2DL38_9HYPH|nr:hypothetical protein DEM27_22125 [Rhizobium album]